jgi:hypothetical protein
MVSDIRKNFTFFEDSNEICLVCTSFCVSGYVSVLFKENFVSLGPITGGEIFGPARQLSPSLSGLNSVKLIALCLRNLK